MEQLKKGLLILDWVFLDFKIWAHIKVTEIPSQHNRSWGENAGRRWHRTLTGREDERWVNFPAFIRTLLEHCSGHQTDKTSRNVTCNVTTELLTNAAPTKSVESKAAQRGDRT